VKTYDGADIQIHVFLMSAVLEGGWSASRHGCFIPWEIVSDTHLIGERVGPRTCLDYVDKGKILLLPRFELRSLCRPGRMSRNIDWAIPALLFMYWNTVVINWFHYRLYWRNLTKNKMQISKSLRTALAYTIPFLTLCRLRWQKGAQWGCEVMR
jgi:hypothetical protein